ncbi:MAG: HEAT repeat domain-containing protein [Synechococcus lacustris]|jgi:HEAT repeat protein
MTNLDEIRAAVASGDTTQRVRAITALREFPADDCVPLLLECLRDEVFLVRSLACMGLGYKRNQQSLQALLLVLESEGDANVRAEAANSLARHGAEAAVAPLLALYQRDDHWLVRRSILAALGEEEGVPDQVIWQLAELALADGDTNLQLSGVELLNRLVNAPVFSAQALARLEELRQSSNHRLAGAALERLLPPEPC